MKSVSLECSLTLLFFAGNYTTVTTTYVKVGDGRCNVTFVKTLFDSMRLDCPGNSTIGNQWKHEDDFLFADKHMLYKKFGNDVVLLRNYSLYLGNISFLNEGVYECMRNSSLLMKYCLQIIVVPDVYITAEYQRRNTIAAERYKVGTFVCTANGSKPAVNLTWTIDNQYGQPPETFHVSTLPGRRFKSTYNTVSHLRYTPINVKENITCIVSHPLFGEISAYAQIVTYVSPNFSITVNDKSTTGPVYIEWNTNMTANCSVFYVPLTTNISWVTNNFQTRQRSTRGYTFVFNTTTETQYVLSTILTFQPLTDDGNLACEVNDFTTFGEKHFNFTYITYVPPYVMFMTVENYVVSNKTLHVVPGNREINIACHAYGSRPASTLTIFAGKQKIHSLNNVRKSNYSKQVETFDSITNITYIPSKLEEQITCITNDKKPFGREHLNVKLLSYVSSRVSLTINGRYVKNMTNYTYQDKLSILCQAIGTVPSVNLSILVDENLLQNTSERTTNLTNETKYYISMTKLTFKPTVKSMKITCINYDLEVVKINAFVDLRLHAESSALHASLIPTGLALIFICVVAATVCASWWFHKQQSSTKSHSMELRGTIDNSIPTLNDLRSSSLTTDLQSSYNRIIFHPSSRRESASGGNLVQETDCNYLLTNECARKDRQFSVSLPEVPIKTDEQFYSSPSRYEDMEDACYTEFRQSTAVGKCILRKHVCQICQIKSGDVYSRWMGSMSLKCGGKKCVLLSTFSERSVIEKTMQWDAFVKRVLELPESTSIVTVEGFYVDNGSLYLVHEYLTCETLESYLQSRSMNSNYSSAADISLLEVQSFTSDILKGIELLHSYGFLHPKLSTQKILYKRNGRLCLYDFCLSEDAPKIIWSMKLKNSYSLNELPPESLLRNEYTSSSDLWSVAVVIWNILSGANPFTSDSHIETTTHGYCETYVEWPSDYSLIRNPQILTCWNVNSRIRPSARDLRLSFEEIFASLNENIHDKQDLSLISSDTYTPMKGNTERVLKT